MHSLRRFDWTLQLLTIALCAYFIAKAVSVYIGGMLEGASSKSTAGEKITPLDQPKEAEKETVALESYQIIGERNVFNAAEGGSVKDVEPGTTDVNQLGDLGPAVKTTLDIKLLGTLSVGEGKDRRSSATLLGGKDAKGVETYYPADEKSFAAGVKLTKVDKDRIEFVRNGRLEFAELEDITAKKTIFASSEEVHGKATTKDKGDEKVSSSPDSGKITIEQREVDDALQNLDKLMTEIRIVPNFKDGRSDGMKVLSVKPGSVVAKLGIKRGDILEKVNGQDLDMKQGMELFNQMKDLKNFSLDVTRGGRNQKLEYEIK